MVKLKHEYKREGNNDSDMQENTNKKQILH